MTMSVKQHVYINFVAATNNLNSSSDSPESFSKQNDGSLGTLTGDEAKSLYENIVSVTEGKARNLRDEMSTGARPRGLPTKNSKSQSHCLVDTHRTRTKKRAQHSRYVKTQPSTTDGLSDESKPTIVEKPNKIANEFLRHAQEGNLREVKRIFRSYSIDINVKDRFLWTPLMCSAQAGHKWVVKFLLREGAMWRNICDQQGKSALDLARLAGHSDIESMLLEHEKQQHSFSLSDAPYVHVPASFSFKGNEKLWCSVCQLEYREDKRKHDASTAHLFNTQHKAHKTVYYIPENSVGYQMMVSSGWDTEKGEYKIEMPKEWVGGQGQWGLEPRLS